MTRRMRTARRKSPPPFPFASRECPNTSLAWIRWMGINRKSLSLSPKAFMLGLAGAALVLFALQKALKHHTPAPPAVLITELFAHNGSGLRDQDGAHSDWIELYNDGSHPGH